MAFPRGFGYVLDFSDNSISEFFEDEFGIDLYDEKYAANGTSKRNRLSTLIAIEDAFLVTKVLRALWDRREGLIGRTGVAMNASEEKHIGQSFLAIISEVETGATVPEMDGFDRYTSNRTLEELIVDIERDLQADKPEAAMDHLHTYCTMKIGNLLQTRGIAVDKGEALHARFGKYRKVLAKERELTQFTDRALGSIISLFDSFNHIRNDRSFAHDNRLLEPAEARFVFDTISGVLVFLRAIEAGRYEP